MSPRTTSISHATASQATVSQARYRSNDARDDRDDDRDNGPRGGKLMDDLMADLENGDLPLDERLAKIGIDAEEYKAYDNKHHYIPVNHRR